uniref:BPI2 domain-containing protein n=1 Tax=Plectus sambesii TaxID=2011161 RepID=A0A914X0K4_9BILA
MSFRSIKTFQLLFIFLFVCWAAASPPEFHPLLGQGVQGSAGIKLRLMRKGLDYLNQIAANVVAEQLPKLRIPDVRQKLPTNQGDVQLSNIRITRFKRADYQDITPKPPNIIVWSMNNMDIGLAGDLGGKVNIILPLVLEGQAEIVAEGISFYMESALEKTVNGAPKVRSLSCEAKIGKIDITNHNGGLAGIAVNTFKIAISDQLRPVLQTLICNRARGFIDVELNEKLEKTPINVPLSSASDMDILGLKTKKPDETVDLRRRPISPIARRTKRQANSGQLPTQQRWLRSPWRNPGPNPETSESLDLSPGAVMRSSGKDMKSKLQKLNITELFGSTKADSLYIDYRLMNEPLCTREYIEMVNAGEISYLGQGNTPFHPDTLTWQNAGREPMFALLISDFLPNSLLYHSYKQRLLRFRVGPETAEFGQFLKTSCDGGLGAGTPSTATTSGGLGVCIGDLIPQLAEKFPDKEVELLFSASRAPAMLFSQKNGGVVSINLKGVIFVYIRLTNERVRQAAVLDLDVVADTTVSVTKNRIKGSVLFNRFQLTNKYGTLGLTNEELNDLGFLATEILQGVVNNLLGEGLPIPIPPVVKLINPTLSIFNREMLISTDLAIDEKLVNDLASQALQEGLGH